MTINERLTALKNELTNAYYPEGFEITDAELIEEIEIMDSEDFDKLIACIEAELFTVGGTKKEELEEELHNFINDEMNNYMLHGIDVEIADIMQEIITDCYNLPNWLLNYIDFEAIGEDELNSGCDRYFDTSRGILEEL